MGAIEKTLLKQAKRFNEPIPDRIKNKPRLGLGLDIYLDAFFDLENDRNWILGTTAHPLPIAWGTLIQYAEMYELTGIMREELIYFVRALDNAYIAHLNGKT